jgi:hypothetical protein
MKTKLMKALFSSLAVVSALAGAGAISIGAASAVFGASESNGTDTFAAGTVSVGAGTPTSVSCAVTTMMPGDSSAGFGSGSAALTKCSYKVKYSGTAGAWLGVDVAVNGGTTNLFTGTASGLQFKVSVNGVGTMVNGTTYKTLAGVDTTIQSGTPVANLLINTTQAATDSEYSIDVEYALPLTAPNALQGGTASMALTFHATQSANNPIGSCVANQQCSTVTWG